MRRPKTRTSFGFLILAASVTTLWWVTSLEPGGPVSNNDPVEAAPDLKARQGVPQGARQGSPGAVGVIASSPRGEVAAIPKEGWVSPDGQRFTEPARDDSGTLLPLDIWRPRSLSPERPRPSLGEIAERRHQVGAGPFVENRLGADDGHTQNETSIALDGNTLIAGWNQATNTGIVMGVGRSADSGGSWSSDTFGSDPIMSDPAVSAGGDGRWYFAFLGGGGSGGPDVEVFVRRSTDDGATWEGAVAATDNSVFDDKPYIASRGDEVVVAYADFGFSPAKVRVVSSTDGGLTFGNNTVLANNSVGGNGACPVVAADGSWYVFWRDSFQQFMWMSKSTDQGVTWSDDESIVAMDPLATPQPGGFRMVNLPAVAVGPDIGHLVMVWNDELFGDPDILAVTSIDGGVTWSPPVRVNDDVGSQAQFLPWVAIDDNGRVHVMWYDRRIDGVGIDVYLASSADGGLSFAANRRITPASFPVVLPHEGGLVDFIGDYNAIAAGGGTIYPFYQDARSGVQDVYVAVVPDDLVFVDGFESGDASAWTSNTVAP